MERNDVKCVLIHDNFQNFKPYNIPKAQLVIADITKIHPSQKPVSVLKRLIGIFTDPGDVVIAPCAGSSSTLRAARELGRNSYGIEVSRDFYRKAQEQMLGAEQSLGEESV